MPDRYYDTLMSTLMEQVKGTRATKVKSGISTIDLIDVDIPTINPNYNIEDYDSYIDSMIQAYNRYLGYESGVTKSNVKNCFTEGLRVYCFMNLIKRYYDAQSVTLPGGEKVENIFDTYELPSIEVGEDDTTAYIGHRLATDIKGVSNKTWVTDYINKVEQVLLPPQIMAFYNYYLTSMFDISNDNNKEAVTLIRFWICDETSEFITRPTNSSLLRRSNMLPVLNKSIFDSAFSALETYLTPSMRNFVTTFLGWRKPNQDWTRDITGNTLNILRDEKLISTFNNIYPEKVTICTHTADAKEEETAPLQSGNYWVRYYYDFEQLLDCEESDEVVASKYYFGIDGVNIEQMFLESNDQVNTIILNYYHYLLLSMLCSEEISGSKEEYVGGMLSSVTTIDATTGLYFPNTGDLAINIKQFCYGNNIHLYYNDYGCEVTIIHDFSFPYSANVLGGMIGDYGEAGDFKDQVAIFNFPIKLDERWYVIPLLYQEIDTDGNYVYTSGYTGTGWVIRYAINADFTEELTPANLDPNVDYSVSHRNDHEAFNCYVLNPEEVHLALHTTIYLLMTGYRTYNEAITAIDSMFRGKQQSTN